MDAILADTLFCFWISLATLARTTIGSRVGRAIPVATLATVSDLPPVFTLSPLYPFATFTHDLAPLNRSDLT